MSNIELSLNNTWNDVSLHVANCDGGVVLRNTWNWCMFTRKNSWTIWYLYNFTWFYSFKNITTIIPIYIVISLRAEIQHFDSCKFCGCRYHYLKVSHTTWRISILYIIPTSETIFYMQKHHHATIIDNLMVIWQVTTVQVIDIYK